MVGHVAPRVIGRRRLLRPYIPSIACTHDHGTPDKLLMLLFLEQEHSQITGKAQPCRSLSENILCCMSYSITALELFTAMMAWMFQARLLLLLVLVTLTVMSPMLTVRR